MILPVLNSLRKTHPQIKCDLLALTTGRARAIEEGETPWGYSDFVRLYDEEAVAYWGNRLLAGNRSPDVDGNESCAYLGINYLDLIDQNGLQGAAEIYSREGRYGFRPLGFMRRLLDEIRPDVVIATNSPRTERAALEVAVQQKIPCVGMVDLFAQDGDSYISQKEKPNWTCVISERIKQRLVDRGFKSEGVIVTGSPAFDGLFSPRNRAAAEDFLKQRGWETLNPILWTGHIEPLADGVPDVEALYRFPLSIETALREFVTRRKDLALIVRYHPSQWQDFPRLGPHEKVYFSVPSQEAIHPLILASKAVVVQNSTVGLQAAVAGKPVVSLEHSLSVLESFSLSKLGVSTPCFSTGELPVVLDSLLASPAAAPQEYASDGNAADRVATVILRALAV